MTLSFRRATAADVPAVVALVESAYRGEASRAGWTTEADLLDGQRTDAAEVAELVAGATTRIILAESDGALCASVLLAAEPDGAYVGMFAVRPDLQGGGVGRALLAEAERVARGELGQRTIRMTVISLRHELIAWYARRGYRPTGAREPFPYHDPRAGKPRRDDLEFIVLRKDLSASR